MKFRTVILCLLVSLPITAFSAGTGGGGMGGVPASPRDAKSPEERSEQSYKYGIRHKEKAWKQEKKAAEASTDKKRDKALERAQKFYAKAIASQRKALAANPRNHEAANELGYALRKTGDYKKAIGAYNYALELRPKFYEAIEYRGEAFLALGFVEDAQRAYMMLFRNRPELAEQLMSEIESWHSNQPTPSEKLTRWIKERKTLAEVNTNLSSANARDW